MLAITVFLTPAGTVDAGGMLQPAYLNFNAQLLAPPAPGMKVLLSSIYYIVKYFKFIYTSVFYISLEFFCIFVFSFLGIRASMQQLARHDLAAVAVAAGARPTLFACSHARAPPFGLRSLGLSAWHAQRCSALHADAKFVCRHRALLPISSCMRAALLRAHAHLRAWWS